MAARKHTPIEVVYFPKRAKVAAAAAKTQTIPALELHDVDPITEVDVVVSAATSKKRPKSGERRKHEPKGSLADGLADMLALGHELFTRGKIHEARVVFEGLLVSNPRDAFVHTMLGTIHLSQHDLDAALASFEKALSFDPDDIAARVYRGELRLNKKRYRAATDDLNWALRVADPKDPFAERAKRLLKLARRSAKP